MSETNLKKFASLIISLSSQVTDVENKCIKPYVDGELYPRDSYVSYNGYIYQATATNQDSAFNETHWDKLSDDFNELTVADIEDMLGLSQEQLETMANLIADTEVRLDKTYSSSKIYQDIQQCLNDSKTFTLLELGKFSGVSYKIVASTSEMTSDSIIYLLANGNTYDMYIAEENGATTKIGDMDIDLSQYYTKTEIDNDFLKKVDADGKYATITTVDGKIDKDKIVTALDDTVTDEQVPSAKSVFDTIKDSVFDTIKDSGLIWQGIQFLQNSQESSVVDYCKSNFIAGLICGFRLQPKDENGYFGSSSLTILYCLSSVNYGWILGISDKSGIPMAIIQIINREPSKWQRACITSVVDVGVTTITPVNGAITGTIEYTVKNGICYVSMKNVNSATTINDLSISTTMPKSSINCGFSLFANGRNGNIGFIYIDKNTTKLNGNFWVAGVSGSCSFSYPVAES